MDVLLFEKNRHACGLCKKLFDRSKLFCAKAHEAVRASGLRLFSSAAMPCLPLYNT
jgi:hypothetical protein